MIRFLILTFLFSLSLFFASAQNALDLVLDGTEKDKKLSTYLHEIELSYPVHFHYYPEWLETIYIEESYKGTKLSDALDSILLPYQLSIIQMNENAVVLVKDVDADISRDDFLHKATQERRKIFKLVFGDAKALNRPTVVHFRGTVFDEKNDAPLEGVSFLINDSKSGTISTKEGKFDLALKSGKHIIEVNYINHDELVIDLEIYQDGNTRLGLQEIPKMLNEVVVMGSEGDITSSAIGQTQINIRSVKRSPSLLGEADLIKQIQLLPGVATVSEAATGFNVRGGGADQNLVLYDGVPIFNGSHVFGFFSSFNSEAIKTATFIKAGLPVEYGGKISSVLNITSKEGDYEKWNFNAGISPLSFSMATGGPITKNKTSLTTSFRTSYSDWLLNTLKGRNKQLENSSASFYDGSIKLAHKFNPNAKLTLSAYSSHDQFSFSNDSLYKWNSQAMSARFDYNFSSAFSMNATAGLGNYSYTISDVNSESGFDMSYRLLYPNGKVDFLYQLGAHKISFGSQFTIYKFNPGQVIPRSNSIKQIRMEQQQSIENAVYVGDAFSVSDRLFLEGGLRVSAFTIYGPGHINIYQPDQPIETYTLTDTLAFSKGQRIKTYFGLEPRLSLRYVIDPTLTFKMAYDRTFQYIHLVSNTAAITPVDIWQPSNIYFKPENAHQISIGLFKSVKEKFIDVSLEVYYKSIQNILDFKDGAQLILNPHLETDLLQGKGTTYGAESSLTKSFGRFTGTLSYTYARSFRKFNGNTQQEKINKGEKYPSNYDQPNTANFSWRYGITRRHFITGQFTYHTGRPVTLPLSSYSIENMPVADFSERNKYRIPDYHRLDVALVIEGNHKRKKLWDGTFTLGLYNVYARKNAYSVFFKDDGTGRMKPYKLSVISTAIPSISYAIKI